MTERDSHGVIRVISLWVGLGALSGCLAGQERVDTETRLTPEESRAVEALHDFAVSGEFEIGTYWHAKVIRDHIEIQPTRDARGPTLLVNERQLLDRPTLEALVRSTEAMLKMLSPIVVSTKDEMADAIRTGRSWVTTPADWRRQFISVERIRATEQELMFLSCTHVEKDRDLLTIYSRITPGVPLGATAFSVDPSSTKTSWLEIVKLLEPLKRGGRLFIIGDDPQSLDFNSLANILDFEIVRRPLWLRTPIIESHIRLANLRRQSLRRSTTVVVDGVSETIGRLSQTDKHISEWSDFRKQLHQHVVAGHQRVITKKEEVLEQLRSSTNDVLMFVVHASSREIEVNGARISIDDLKTIRRFESNAKRTRVAIVVGCGVGNTTVSPHESFAGALVFYGIVDAVFAPRTAITPTEGIAMARRLLSRHALQFSDLIREPWRLIGANTRSDLVAAKPAD